MVRMLTDWYKQKFSDPNAVALIVILLALFVLFYFFNNILMPVFVALAIAFLLDKPVNRLSRLGLGRSISTTVIVTLFVGISMLAILGLMPIVWQQGANLINEAPAMISSAQQYLFTLPERYPELISVEQLQTLISLTKQKVLQWGELILEGSLNSLSNIVALLVYLILVPLMVFFFLKDKQALISQVTRFLPKERRLASQVGDEMNQQILNYVRGKIIEILIIGAASTLAFLFLDLRYAVLLGVLVGLSVLVPYVGATIVTIPVLLVALFQFGISPEFGYVMLAYGIIQALDGNLLVPLLFSEAVNLHPVTIIVAVIFFGGLWGFWGVFFAIPLATLVKAVINAWSTQVIDAPQQQSE
ncbi:AI-2E family transporter [Thalassotalea sp. LPB0316]|uniref:AI-2E family transporter n=1 Tax=Thalassotalea sp. LPB0316 TaxID=2769490 RepID=UPI001868555F|nr:AI-2E family transporter [Thalassotalea sp. LPB0316]QOL25180.1 AI-2E family transporter [Thalassotalea sp. LPB0316]